MRLGLRVALGVVLALAGAAATCAGAQVVPVVPAAARNAKGVSLEEYKTHLAALEGLTAECAKGRDKAGCDPNNIGADDNVNLPGAGTRVVRYDWLRALLVRAQKPDADAGKPDNGMTIVVKGAEDTFPAPKTTTQLLNEAQKRLAADLAQTGETAQAAAAHEAESKAMREVLARREFRRLGQVHAGQSVYEKMMEWLNRIFSGVGSVLIGAAWVGRLLFWAFLLAVGAGLLWALMQLERRWRVRLVPDADGPAPGAASARDWQLWLEDARRAAAQGQWREAIHFVYWASISRLESRRLWPADRARTPREYLALVAPEDPRKAGLAALTGSFERVWYGGREASEADYQRADSLASSLIQGGPASAASASLSNGGQAR